MKFKLGPMALDLYKRYFSNQPYLMIQGPRLRISSEQNCETHKKRLDIYCQTCSIMICERCILTGTHKGHIGVDLELKIKELNSFISNGSMKETYIKIIEMEKASLLKKKNELKDLEKFIQDKEVVIKEIENRVEILQSYDTIDETNYINSFHFVTQVFNLLIL